MSIVDQDHHPRKNYTYLREKTSALWPLLSLAFYLLPDELRNPSKWQSIDPLLIGQKLLGPHTANILIQSSSDDQFAFNVGAKIFTLIAKLNGAPVRHTERHGGHCMIQADELVDFLQAYL